MPINLERFIRVSTKSQRDRLNAFRRSLPKDTVFHVLIYTCIFKKGLAQMKVFDLIKIVKHGRIED